MAVVPPDPGPPRRADLRRTIVLAAPPWLGILGLTPEVEFTAGAGRHMAGVYRTRDGHRITVAVDPSLDGNAYVLEDALTGEVIRRGRIGERRTVP